MHKYTFPIALVLNYRYIKILKSKGRQILFGEDAKILENAADCIKQHKQMSYADEMFLYKLFSKKHMRYESEPPKHIISASISKSVRLAWEVKDQYFLLVYQCDTPIKLKQCFRNVKNLPGYFTDCWGFEWCDVNFSTQEFLRRNRWFVYSETLTNTIMAKYNAVKINNELLDVRLYPYQREGVRMLEAGYSLLADEMGLGKTCQVIQFVCLHPEMKKILVVCPASLKINWSCEFVMWHGAILKDIQILSSKNVKGFDSSKRVYIINYDILTFWVDLLSLYTFDLLVADECHKIQNSKALCTKAFKRIAKKSTRKIFISGTPLTSHMIQFFTTLNLIDPAKFPDEFTYGIDYCGGHYVAGKMIFDGASNLTVLHSILSEGIMIRRLKKDVLMELPEKKRIVVPLFVEKVSEQEKSELNKKIKKAENNQNLFSVFEYLRQLAYVEKRHAILQWIENFLSSGRKLVVFAIHKIAVNEIFTQFQDIAVKIDGTSTQKQRELAVKKFQDDNHIRLFVGNLQAAGVGLTLTAASDTCTVELGYSSSLHLQSEDRVHRVGQKNAVNNYYLILPDSIESTMITILNKKLSTFNELFDRNDGDILLDLKNIWKIRDIDG